MKKKLIGIVFLSMLMLGVISYVNAGPSETAALDRDRDRISDRDRDQDQDCTSEDCGDELRLRDRFRYRTSSGVILRNRTGLTNQIRSMIMNHIDDCDQSNKQTMSQIRERIRILQCEDILIA